MQPRKKAFDSLPPPASNPSRDERAVAVRLAHFTERCFIISQHAGAIFPDLGEGGED